MKVLMGPHGNEMCDHFTPLVEYCRGCEAARSSLKVRISFQRDYRDRTSRQFGYSTGVYQNFGERVSFRYVHFQVRGIGSLQFDWTVNGFEEGR